MSKLKVKFIEGGHNVAPLVLSVLDYIVIVVRCGIVRNCTVKKRVVYSIQTKTMSLIGGFSRNATQLLSDVLRKI